MPWYSKEQPTPFDATPLVGVYFIDGDQLARQLGHWEAQGKKCPMIAFPSSEILSVAWDEETNAPYAHLFIHGFEDGEIPPVAVDAPLMATRDAAAADIGNRLGDTWFTLFRVGDERLLVHADKTEAVFLLTYDNQAGRLVDVEVSAS